MDADVAVELFELFCRDADGRLGHTLQEGNLTAYDYDLGSYTRPVTTALREAQLWFDRGLVWCYGYNHEEAVLCFQEAARADPDCAMAYWGIAYAAGPNYNKQW